MSGQSDVIQIDGQEFVETEDHLYALGLQFPEHRSADFPTLATMAPLLDMAEIKRIVESQDFKFGRAMFDSSWTTNQNGYGSCAAYGGSSALAKARVIGGQKRVDLSGDYLYSLVNGGRDRGSMLDDCMKTMLSKGVCSASTVPLGGIYRSKYNTGAADAEARRFRGHELYAVPDEQSMATALALRIPVVIAIHVTGSWRRFDSDNILAPCNGVGNHCEHLDDIMWSAKRGCLLYRKATSHGKDYSKDGGYCWTLWADHYKQTSRNHMFYAVPSAIEDPQGDNPFGGAHGDDSGPEPITDEIVITRTSSSGCVWCDRWKATEEPKVAAAGYTLVDGQVPGSGVPRFRLSVNGQTKDQIGFWKFDDIERAIASMR